MSEPVTSLDPTSPPTRRRYLVGALLALALGALSLAVDPLKPWEAETEAWVGHSVRSVAASYVAVRGVNAMVSVVKESHLDLEPAGVGVSIAAGQVLDPLDDLTERLADVLVHTLAVLGAYQTFAPLLSQLTGFGLVAACFALGLAWLLVGLVGGEREGSRVARRGGRYALGLVGSLLVLRLVAPAAMGLGSHVQQTYLDPRAEAARAVLDAALVDVKALGSFEVPDAGGGLFGTVTGMGELIAERVAAVRRALSTLGAQSDAMVAALLELFVVGLSVLILHGLLLPALVVAVSWLCLKRIVGVRG